MAVAGSVSGPARPGWSIRRLIAGRRDPVVVNLGARMAALGSLTLSSVLVARTGGAAAVGTFVLLRLLPWLTGVLLSFGLYGAAPYFLAGPHRTRTGFRSTMLAMALAGGGVGGLLWAALAPLIGSRLFPDLALPLVAWAGVMVLTQTMETTAKACSQGFSDLPGSNRIIVLEEVVFLPIYGALVGLGVPWHLAMIAALPLGDVVTGGSGWVRLTRRGFFREAGRPSLRLAREVAGYGVRAQLGSLILLVNARLDFAIVELLLGPTALGIYAVASRFAELLRLPSLAVNYVMYPDYARAGGPAAARRARALLPRVAWIPVAAALPLALLARYLLPILYTSTFRAAIVPTYVLIAGLLGTTASGLITAFLYGDGRPGLNSLATAGGMVVTVGLDLLLIPRFGVMGAAAASCAAYLTTTALLLTCFAVARRRYAGLGAGQALEPVPEVAR